MGERRSWSVQRVLGLVAAIVVALGVGGALLVARLASKPFDARGLDRSVQAKAYRTRDVQRLLRGADSLDPAARAALWTATEQYAQRHWSQISAATQRGLPSTRLWAFLLTDEVRPGTWSEPYLRRLMRHRDREIRVLAARSLSRYDAHTGPILSADLATFLSDVDPEVRAWVRIGLGNRGDTAQRDELVALLDWPGPLVRLSAVGALVRCTTNESFPAAAVATLAESDPDYDVQAYAASALAGKGVESGRLALQAMLQRPEPLARVRAACELARQRDALAAPVLVEILGEPDATLQGLALGGLRSYGPRAWAQTPRLREALHGLDPSQKEMGAITLADLGDESATEQVVALVGAQSTFIAREALRACQALGPCAHAAEPAARARLSSPNAGMREDAAGARGRVGADEPASIDALRGRLSDKEAHVALMSAAALACLGHAEGLDVLRRSLAEPGWVQTYAAVSIRHLGPAGAPACADLRALTAGPDVEAADRAWTALAYCGAKPDPQSLAHALGHGDATFWVPAAGAMVCLGDHAAEASLSDGLHSEDVLVRQCSESEVRILTRLGLWGDVAARPAPATPRR